MELTQYGHIRKSITLDDFMDNVYEDSKGKHDYNVNSSQIKMDTLARITTKPLEGAEGFNLEFDSLGLNQMCDKIGIKELSTYGQKLIEQSQTVRMASLFNYHLDDYNKSGGSDLWVRSKEGKCRAVFSDKYGIYDNDFVADIINKYFKDKNVDIVGNSINNNYMNCRIRLLDSVFNAATKNGKEDPLYMAIHVMNSEVGLSSVNIFLVIYRLVCTNGLIRESSNMVFRQKHIGSGHEKADEIAERLTMAFEYAQAQGKEQLEEFNNTREEIIELPMENIQYLSRSQGYSQRFTELVEQNYLEEKDNTRFGIINAFTAASRDLQYEDRLSIERFAGSLIQRNLLK